MRARNAGSRDRSPGDRILPAAILLLPCGCGGGPTAVPYVPPPETAAPDATDPRKVLRVGEDTGGIVARVNDRPITDWELEERLPPPYRNRDRWKDPDVAKIVFRTVRNLAEHRILIDAAKDFGITVSDGEVDAEIRREREDLKLTPEEYKRQVEQGGRPYIGYLDDIREQLLIKKLIGRQMYGLYVPPREIRSQYRENPKTFTEEETVSFKLMVIAAARAGGSAEAKALAEAIRRQMEQGGDFDTLCATYRRYAPDEASAGGRVENVSRGRLPSAVEQVVFNPDTPIPGCTPVLPFNSDWAILHLIDRRGRRLRSFEDAQLQEGINRALLHERFMTRRNEILREHLQRAVIWPPGLFPPGYPETGS